MYIQNILPPPPPPQPLLELPQPYRKASLSVSTMIHSYCRHNSDCDYDTEIQDMIRIFEDKLRYNCKAETPDMHDQILMSLKALGNSGYALNSVPTLNRCFQNPEVPNEVRVAAIDAFRRLGCGADVSICRLFFSSISVNWHVFTCL